MLSILVPYFFTSIACLYLSASFFFFDRFLRPPISHLNLIYQPNHHTRCPVVSCLTPHLSIDSFHRFLCVFLLSPFLSISPCILISFITVLSSPRPIPALALDILLITSSPSHPPLHLGIFFPSSSPTLSL